jgi:WD40 repeat protein
VLVYDLPDWSPVFDLASVRDDAWADAVGLSPDGRRLATEFFGDPEEDTLEMWDIASGERIWSASASSNFWGTARFSPDGRSLLSAGMEPPEVWVADSGALAFETDGDEPARRATWSPDGSVIAAGVDDGSIHLWSASTGEQLLTLRGHSNDVMEVEVAGDGPILVSIDAGGRVLVWTLDIDELLEIAESRLTRDFTDDECRTYLHGPCPER